MALASSYPHGTSQWVKAFDRHVMPVTESCSDGSYGLHTIFQASKLQACVSCQSPPLRVV